MIEMKAKKFLGMVALFLLTGFGVTAMCRVALADNKETQTIYAGVYLDGVYVGGLTKEEAMEEYDKYIDGVEDLDVTFTTAQGSYSFKLKDIGIEISVEDAVNQAYNYGRKGNIFP